MRWLAGGLAVALVLGLLWGGAQPVAVGLVRAPWDKLLHFGVFGVLAAAVGVALGRASLWWLALGVAVAVGVADEWHQLSLPGRSAGWGDLVADACGALAGAGVAAWVLRWGRGVVAD